MRPPPVHSYTVLSQEKKGSWLYICDTSCATLRLLVLVEPPRTPCAWRRARRPASRASLRRFPSGPPPSRRARFRLACSVYNTHTQMHTHTGRMLAVRTRYDDSTSTACTSLHYTYMYIYIYTRTHCYDISATLLTAAFTQRRQLTLKRKRTCRSITLYSR